MSDRQRVAVVTGGGGGIGAAIAESLGRTGVYVVTVDPLVSVDGSEQLPAPEETTAGRITAAGGAARASAVSVTDASGVRGLFEELDGEFGGLDAVVNVAGITRPTSFATGTDDAGRITAAAGPLARRRVGDRRVGCARPIRGTRRRIRRPGRCGHVAGITRPPVSPPERRRLAQRAVGPPRWLSQRSSRCSAADGSARAGPHPGRHLGFGMAVS
ncbi:short chain dehydrogenase family protein [Mycobacterium intracellulare MIN_052511_1280]|nr:short chain dehydrogenase family protein [Mycobacterium intracellulare MIN_052511_1280]